MTLRQVRQARQVSKSGVDWEPVAIDEHGKVLAFRVFTHDDSLPLWQLVQVTLDSDRVTIG